MVYSFSRYLSTLNPLKTCYNHINSFHLLSKMQNKMSFKHNEL